MFESASADQAVSGVVIHRLSSRGVRIEMSSEVLYFQLESSLRTTVGTFEHYV